MADWNPAVIGPKEGGVFQDSPIAPGRRLVFAVDATAIETFDLDVNDNDQDGLIAQAQDLMRLLNKARAYQSTEFQDSPVWVRARSECETNDRYALIINWSIPQLDNPYAPPFFSATELATMEDISLQLERGHWLALRPGVGECVQVSNRQAWKYLLDFTVVNSVALAAQAPSTMVEPVSGNLLAGRLARAIIRSTDGGDTWIDNLTGLPLGTDATVRILYQIASGRVMAGVVGTAGGGSPLIKTDDDATSWTSIADAAMVAIYDIVQLTSGRIIAVGSGSGTTGKWYSDNNGGAWTGATGAGVRGTGISIAVAANGNIISGTDQGKICSSSDSGATWSVLGFIRNGFPIYKIIKATDNNLYAVTYSQVAAPFIGELWISNDNGSSWSLLFRYNDGRLINIIEGVTPGELWMSAVDDGGFSYLYFSFDYGLSWQPNVNTGAGTVSTNNNARLLLYQTANTKIYLGVELSTPTVSRLYRTGLDTTTNVGQEATCANSVYTVNKHNRANLTHIYIDDGGVFSANLFPMSAFPVSLYPATPANNDALYFGSQNAVFDSGPFSSLVFDLATPAAGTYTLTWQYYNGAWVTLTTRDNSVSLATPGRSSVHWVQPADWTLVAVNGITGYWVRALLSGVSSMTAPTQQNRNIYTITSSSVAVDILQVTGDIPAIVQIKAQNQSDQDGSGGSAPNLFSNRLIVGLRSFETSTLFQAYLNISNEQNPIGVVVTLGTNTTFVADTTTPTGLRAVYNPGGVEAMATRATITLSPSIARDFYGTFHAFLRASRTAGVSSDLSIRLQLTTGSGGIIFTTQSKQLQTTTAFEVLDFGEIALPVSGSFKSSDLGDLTTIAIQASAASGTPDLYLYDLILIPVDEWAIDAIDQTNSTLSDIGRSNGVAKLLDIDSLTDPREDIKTLVRQAGGGIELITAEYNPICSGGAILQTNALQALWFVAMQASATGASYSWLAPPETSHTIQAFKNERYLGLIGAG